LYFMVTPTAPVRPHRIRNDQLYHYYLGDPLEVFLLRNDGTSERVILGPDLCGGERIQLFIPGNTFHTARVMGRRRWFLGASTEWPGVVPADVETGNVEELAGKYPSSAADLRAIAASVRHDRGSAKGASGEPIFPACSTSHARKRVSGVTPVRPPQPSLKAGPVDQLTTPITASAPPTSR